MSGHRLAILCLAMRTMVVERFRTTRTVKSRRALETNCCPARCEKKKIYLSFFFSLDLSLNLIKRADKVELINIFSRTTVTLLEKNLSLFIKRFLVV